MANKKKQNSIIEPTDAELKLYNQVTQGLDDYQLEEYSKEYFGLVQQEKMNVSFPKFIIDKLIRPIKEGDTIEFVDENNQQNFLYALIRKDIEDTTYLIFSKVDNETETLLTDEVYLFYVDGHDENGIEIIDVMPQGEKAEKILDIIEGDNDVEMVNEQMVQETEQE
jgi:hypothetical protein